MEMVDKDLSEADLKKIPSVEGIKKFIRAFSFLQEHSGVLPNQILKSKPLKSISQIATG